MEERNRLLEMVWQELSSAQVNFPPLNSAHEGYAVLLEEVEELWAHVKTNQSKRDIHEMSKECVQIAAMALRFFIDCCEPVGNGYGK